MADPFVAGLAALHGSALGLDARYMPSGGEVVALRVIRSQVSGVREQLVFDTDTVSIRCADVLRPEFGAELQLLGTVSVAGEPHIDPIFRISSEPLLDEEGLAWSCSIELA